MAITATSFRTTGKRIGFVLCLASAAVTGAFIEGAAQSILSAPAKEIPATWALVQTIGQDEYVMDHGLSREDCLSELYPKDSPRGHYACQVER